MDELYEVNCELLSGGKVGGIKAYLIIKLALPVDYIYNIITENVLI